MRKLLIVDDSSLMREQLAQMISMIPDINIVGQVGTVAESLDALKILTPDIIILDLQLTDGSGFQVLKAAKKSSLKIEVIVLTNYPFPQHKSKALAAGADYFFDKSLEFEKVVDALKKNR